MAEISEQNSYQIWARGLNCHQQIYPSTATDPACISAAWRCVFTSLDCPQHLAVCWHSFQFVCKGEYMCRGYCQSLPSSKSGIGRYPVPPGGTRCPVPPGTEIRALSGGGDRLLALTDTGLFLLETETTDKTPWWRSIALQSFIYCPLDGDTSQSSVNSDSVSVEDECSPLCHVAVGAHTLAACCHDGTVRALQPAEMPSGFNDLSPRGCRVVGVVCGRQHVLMLTSAGSVLSFGGNSRGQLGLGHLEDVESVSHVSVLDGIHVVRIAAGSWHSLALSRDGDVYAWGWNESGQLGRDPGEVSVSAEPRLIDDWPPELCFCQIACGARHSLALTDDGCVFGWGNNEFAQLTNSVCRTLLPPCTLTLPTPVMSQGRVVSITAGEGNSLLICSQSTTDCKSFIDCD